MSPSWTRIADEVARIADDRALAAASEPDPVERQLLRREATLLLRAAAHAADDPHDGQMAHQACEGVVVHSDGLVMWGMTEQAEVALRAMAADPGVDPQRVDPQAVLRIILGVPTDPVQGDDAGEEPAGPGGRSVVVGLAALAVVLAGLADLGAPLLAALG